jgi:hypothetical protein
MRHSPWRVLYGLVGWNVDFILTCLIWSDEGTKTLVSRGNLDMSCETLVPRGNLDMS